MSSFSTHTFAKRDTALAPQFIAAIVVVVVGFNLIIACAWCLLRGRKKAKKEKLRKRRISAPTNVEMYETSAAFAISTGAAPAVLKTKGAAPPQPQGGSYFELIRALQLQTYQSHAPPQASSYSNPPSPTDNAKLKQFILRPQDMKHLDGVSYYPKAKQAHRTRPSLNLPVTVNRGLARANSLSADTASIYSSASAPLEQHERYIRSQSFALQLETIPGSAPAWVTAIPQPPAPVIVTDTMPAELENPLPSPTASISGSSQSTTVCERSSVRTTSAFHSPISMPNSSMPSLVRARNNSNPSAPPQVRWLTKGATKDTAPSPQRSRRPSSISSLATILSFRETPLPPILPLTAIAPLNVRRQSRDSRWGSVDMTRGAPLVLPTTSASQTLAMAPAVPKRSPFRPAPSASAEHLPR